MLKIMSHGWLSMWSHSIMSFFKCGHYVMVCQLHVTVINSCSSYKDKRCILTHQLKSHLGDYPWESSCPSPKSLPHSPSLLLLSCHEVSQFILPHAHCHPRCSASSKPLCAEANVHGLTRKPSSNLPSSSKLFCLSFLAIMTEYQVAQKTWTTANAFEPHPPPQSGKTGPGNSAPILGVIQTNAWKIQDGPTKALSKQCDTCQMSKAIWS